MTARRTGESDLGPSNAQVAMMRHRIAGEISGAAKRRRRRRVRAAIATAIGGVVAAGVITAGTIVVTAAPPDLQANTFDCFTVADLGGQRNVVAYLDDVSELDAAGISALAIELCARAFVREGGGVPNPTVCELRDLRLAVFPNVAAAPAEPFCRDLGLGVPPQ